MNRRTQYALFATAGVFLVLVGILVGKFVGGSKNNTAALQPSPTPTESVISDSPSPSPSPSPSVSPSPSPSPSPSLAPDEAASAQGALLNADEAGQPQTAAPQGISCKALGDAGWAISQCDAFSFSDTVRKAYVIEHHAPENGGGEGWRVLLLKYSDAQQAWVKELSFNDDSGSFVTRVDAVSMDLTKDGKPEVVFGYGLTGKGNFLAYDVVTAMIGSPTVAVHRELGNGKAIVANGIITDYEARYGTKGECCPVDYLKATVGFTANGWRIQPYGPVKTAPTGNL